MPTMRLHITSIIMLLSCAKNFLQIKSFYHTTKKIQSKLFLSTNHANIMNTNNAIKVVCESEDDLENLGSELGKLVSDGDTILLTGDLGAGIYVLCIFIIILHLFFC